jgi:hypothetical protein
MPLQFTSAVVYPLRDYYYHFRLIDSSHCLNAAISLLSAAVVVPSSHLFSMPDKIMPSIKYGSQFHKLSY